MLLPERVQQVLKQFYISDEVLLRIVKDMQDEFRLGLETNNKSSLAMLPTYVPQLPNGSEAGKYVSIDLSGKNLRIMLLTLKGQGSTPLVATHNFMVHKDVMVGTGDQLFNFIVNCLAKFLDEHGLLQANLPVGFVFSYPCELLSIRSARLLWWTKGFNVVDCLQKDVVQLLENALALNPTLKVRVTSVMNDTVGQLAAAAYKFGPDCVMGVVIGYGCNASYLEDVNNIKKFDCQAKNYTYPYMVIDTEWEEFGAKGELDEILTSFDHEIDEVSVHRGKQIIDKLTGALYLGELVRRVIEQLCLDGLLFGGKQCESLTMPDSFPTKYISEILSDDESTNFKNTRRIADELQISIHGSTDYLILREICYAVSLRSASVAAAAMAALLCHMKRDHVLIGVGGALIQFHPIYEQLLHDKLKNLVPQEHKWDIVLADEGSAKGAALVAAVADSLNL